VFSVAATPERDKRDCLQLGRQRNYFANLKGFRLIWIFARAHVVDATRSGLDLLLWAYPGLAEKRQPWAGGLNPFGIRIRRTGCELHSGQSTI
jgi:hypothetical protein